MRTYKFRIRPSNQQVKKLWNHSCRLNWIYNQFIQAEQTEYTNNKSYLDQYQLNYKLVELKKQDPTLYEIYAQVLQQVSARVHKAYQLFFKRVVIHPPSFRSCSNFFNITYPQAGYSIRGRKLITKAYGEIPIVLHRPIQGTIKTISICYSDHWHVCITTDYNPVKVGQSTDVGIDLGTANLVTTSDQQVIRGPNHQKWYDKQIDKLKARRDTNHKRRSNRHRHLTKVIKQLYRVKSRKTNDQLHKISKDLSSRYDTVYVEDLKVKKMSESKATGRNREIRNHQLGKFISMLEYKVNHLVSVDPMFTSQTCAYCGEKHTEKLSLKVRTFTCEHCGLEIDRDINAALNILHLGRAQSSGLYKGSVSIVNIHPYMWWDNNTRKCLEQAIDISRCTR